MVMLIVTIPWGPCVLRSDSNVVTVLTPTCVFATASQSKVKDPFHTDPFYIPWTSEPDSLSPYVYIYIYIYNIYIYIYMCIYI